MGEAKKPETARQTIDEGRRQEAAGNHDQALERYRAAVGIAPDAATRSEAIRRQSDVLRIHNAWDEALTAAREAEQIATDAQLPDLAAEALNAQGAVYHFRGDLATAEAFYRRMLELSSHPRVRGIALQNIGTVAATRGDPSVAEEHFKLAYAACTEAGYERGALFALLNCARATLDQGKAAVAEELLHEAEVLAIHMMDLDTSHTAALNRAEAMLARQAYDEAETLVSAALGYYGSSGNSMRRMDALRLLGDITLLRGSKEQARIFFEAAKDVAVRAGADFDVGVIDQRLDSIAAD